MKRIVDRIPKPSGALPAKAQTWLLLAVTAVVALVLLTFPGPPVRPAAPDPSPVTADAGALGVTAVESATERIRVEADRRTERRSRQASGGPLPPANGLPPAPTPVGTVPMHPMGGPAGTAGPSAEERIASEERMRRYHSLRTPPLVQSDRDAADRSVVGERPDDPPAAAVETPPEEPEETVAEGFADAGDAPKPDATEDPSTPRYTLFEGEFLEAVLANRLSGDFSGPVNAMVSADAYDRTRQRLLVPRGTRALGRAERIQDWDQSRLLVTFHRLVLPDGRAIALERSAGLNQLGETGLKDIVNRRYVSTIAVAGAVGALAGLTQAVSPQSLYNSRLGAARVSAGTGLAGAAERLLERFLNRMPKITVREGHRLRIYLTADLRLREYDTGRDPYAIAPRQGDQP